jgi:hypothetical protein
MSRMVLPKPDARHAHTLVEFGHRQGAAFGHRGFPARQHSISLSSRIDPHQSDPPDIAYCHHAQGPNTTLANMVKTWSEQCLLGVQDLVKKGLAPAAAGGAAWPLLQSASQPDPSQ